MLVNELLGKLDCSHAELDSIVICCDGEDTCFDGNTFRGQNLIKLPDYLNKEVQHFSFLLILQTIVWNVLMMVCCQL